jgi:hypothetical protein
MNAHLFGHLSWLGYSLPIAVPERLWLAWLLNFTGLEIEPPKERTSVPVLCVLDDRRVLVDGCDLRTFVSLDDLKAWLFLTVSDVMISRGEFAALHAAGFVVAGQAILVSGPPWVGKSSWAFEAQRRGLEVLGDDQVRVDPLTGAVYGLPRPLKRRVVGGGGAQHPSEHAVRAQLDGESVVLEPRGAMGLAPVDRGYPVSRIIHLARHPGPGVEVQVLDRFRALQSILDQMRVYSSTFLADAAASARILARMPSFHFSVGDGQIGQALDRALALN